MRRRLLLHAAAALLLAIAEAVYGPSTNTNDSVLTEIQAALIELNGRLEQLEQPCCQHLRDCSGLSDDSPSGVYTLMVSAGRPAPAYCDMTTDGGGWTVIQRRADIRPRRSFYLGWQDYKWGFGRLNAEFWWGLQNIWLLTLPLTREYELRVDMEDFDGVTRYALYQGFRLTTEADGYRLKITNYTGNAGDGLAHHNNNKFSAKDRDLDRSRLNCAVKFKGGWWYNSCHRSNLNGRYLAGRHSTYADGVNWKFFRGNYYSLKTVEMKIRPTYTQCDDENVPHT